MNNKPVIVGLKNRDEGLFKELFEKLYPELVVYANQYLFDSQYSEDIVQEVFVWLWEKADKMDIKTNLKSYLYAMVRNRCLNALKSIKITDSSKTLESHATFVTDHSTDWYPDDEKQELYEQVLKVIDNFPDKMRTIVKLRFLNNYRCNEIADELGVSVNTVKTQLKRAKLKFGELIFLWVALFLFG